VLDVGEEALAVDGAVEDGWRRETLGSERADEGRGRLPVTVRHGRHETLVAFAAAIGARHVGLARSRR